MKLLNRRGEAVGFIFAGFLHSEIQGVIATAREFLEEIAAIERDQSRG